MTKKVMTPEPITEDQIGKMSELLSAKLRKHKNQLQSVVVQEVLKAPQLSEELYQIIQKRVEALSNMIVRSVNVNRNRSAKQAIDATGRKQYLNDTVVAEIPIGQDEEVEVFFYKLGKQASCTEVDEAFELRGLTPDPIAQMAVNEADPSFTDEHPNGTQWKNSKGEWCFATFDRWDGGERIVGVDRNDNVWDDRWWFAGVLKSTQK